MTERLAAAGTSILSWSPDLARSWDALACRVQATPFLRPGWLEAWRQAFGGTWRIVVDVGEDGRLSGVLPLLGRAGGLVSPTNWHTPAFGAVSEDAATTDRLLAAAVRAARSRVQLSFVDEVLARRALEVAHTHGRRSSARVYQLSRYVPAPEASTPPPVEVLSADKRKKMRRWRRQLEERGAVRLQVREALDTDGLEAFLRIEHSGWKGTGGTSILTDRRASVFYRSAAAWAAEQGMLRIALLTLDDRVLAGDLAIEHSGVHHVLKTGFDESMSDYRPGHLLRLQTLQRAYELGLQYEFLGSDAEWKRRWTPHTHERFRVNVYGAGVFGRAAQSVEDRLRPVARDMVAAARSRRVTRQREVPG